MISGSTGSPKRRIIRQCLSEQLSEVLPALLASGRLRKSRPRAIRDAVRDFGINPLDPVFEPESCVQGPQLLAFVGRDDQVVIAEDDPNGGLFAIRQVVSATQWRRMYAALCKRIALVRGPRATNEAFKGLLFESVDKFAA